MDSYQELDLRTVGSIAFEAKAANFTWNDVAYTRKVTKIQGPEAYPQITQIIP